MSWYLSKGEAFSRQTRKGRAFQAIGTALTRTWGSGTAFNSTPVTRPLGRHSPVRGCEHVPSDRWGAREASYSHPGSVAVPCHSPACRPPRFLLISYMGDDLNLTVSGIFLSFHFHVKPVTTFPQPQLLSGENK